MVASDLEHSKKLQLFPLTPMVLQIRKEFSSGALQLMDFFLDSVKVLTTIPTQV